MLAGYDHLLRAARRLQWDEAAIDLTADAAAWPALDPRTSSGLRRLVAGFCVAERAVAAELEPFGAAAGDPLAVECFAFQAGDEARHARFFARVAREVVGIDPGEEAADIAGAELVELFEHTLPAAAAQLARGERTLAGAVALYHLVLEGIVFAAGQEAALALLDDAPALTGMRAGMERVQADERWHVGLGVLCLAESGDGRPVTPGVDEALARAGAAAHVWGGDVVDSDAVARVLAVHRRRLDVARSQSTPTESS